MYRMSLLPLFAPPSLTSRLDIVRVTKMCLFHDVAESLVGDITPLDNVSKQEKSQRESDTIKYITEKLLDGVPGNGAKELYNIWHEFEQGETDEARFAQDLDKLELMMQAIEYERKYKGTKDLSGFTRVHSRIVLPEMKEWANTLVEERSAMWKSWNRIPISDAGDVTEELKGQLDAYYGKPDDKSQPPKGDR
jgi:putative hydrolases of HD superfamily